MERGDRILRSCAFHDRLGIQSVHETRARNTKITRKELTRQGGIDPPNVDEQAHLGELDRVAWRLEHLVPRDLCTFRRVEDRVDVEFAKGDFARRTTFLIGRLVGERCCAVGEDGLEEVVLDV